MLKKQNCKNVAQLVVKEGLCLGCGICTDLCNKKALKMVVNNKGLNVPVVDDQLCNNCGVCYNHCVGKGLPIQALQKTFFADEEEEQYDDKIGYYQKCYFGYCNDYDVRYHCASGGMVSGLLIYMLEKGMIDGAVVTGYREDNRMHPKTYIARTKEEILKGKSSKYCVVSFEGVLSELKAAEGKYIIVGLPCHIQAIRTVAEKQPKLREKIFGYFAIYCSINKNYKSLEYLADRYNIDTKRLKEFTYRDDGCMGSMKFTSIDDSVLKKIPFIKYYKPMHAFFNCERCTMCVDLYGELADMCFGDIKKDEEIEDTTGESSFVTRTKKFDSIVNHAVHDGYIYAEEISGDFLNSRQNYLRWHKKGSGIIRAHSFEKLIGNKRPVFDVSIPVKYDIGCILYGITTKIERFIGHHKSLWFIIRALDKTKD